MRTTFSPCGPSAQVKSRPCSRMPMARMNPGVITYTSGSGSSPGTTVFPLGTGVSHSRFGPRGRIIGHACGLDSGQCADTSENLLEDCASFRLAGIVGRCAVIVINFYRGRAARAGSPDRHRAPLQNCAAVNLRSPGARKPGRSRRQPARHGGARDYGPVRLLGRSP